MSKKSYEDYEYEDDYEDDVKKGSKRPRRQPEPIQEKKKKWDRESIYDRDHDYDERR
jgi:hypothetical protein